MERNQLLKSKHFVWLVVSAHSQPTLIPLSLREAEHREDMAKEDDGQGSNRKRRDQDTKIPYLKGKTPVTCPLGSIFYHLWKETDPQVYNRENPRGSQVTKIASIMWCYVLPDAALRT